MITQMISRIRFLFSSTNQHGVHSPFVYDYLTNCLYKKPRIKRNKTFEILLRSIPYFKVKNIKIPHKDEGLITKLEGHFPDLKINIPPYDMVVIPIMHWSKAADSPIGSKEPSKEVIYFLTDLYGSKKSKTLWKSAAQSVQFNVSIDLYYSGLLFRRPAQRKQHFKVRI
ncbi:MAG: hypothetical protein AB3N14_01895 [Flavobacteriaceae bacterium]